jgi:hypothetical protein
MHGSVIVDGITAGARTVLRNCERGRSGHLVDPAEIAQAAVPGPRAAVPQPSFSTSERRPDTKSIQPNHDYNFSASRIGYPFPRPVRVVQRRICGRGRHSSQFREPTLLTAAKACTESRVRHAPRRLNAAREQMTAGRRAHAGPRRDLAIHPRRLNSRAHELRQFDPARLEGLKQPVVVIAVRQGS